MRLGISARPQFSKHKEVLDYLKGQPNKSAAAMQLMWEGLQARKAHETEQAEILKNIRELREALSACERHASTSEETFDASG
jgi:uncharacterized protein YukE